MNDTTRPALERRRQARIIAKDAVNLRAEGQALRGRIANLGSEGMFVLTAVTAPDRMLGRAVVFEIRFDGGRAEWLRGTGEIARIHAYGLAVVFEAPPAALLRMIDELATASYASARVMSVVLIDADRDRRSAMAAGFRATGCSVVEAGTPLMRVFVERDHPGAKLVTSGDEVLAPDVIARLAVVGDVVRQLAQPGSRGALSLRRREEVSVHPAQERVVEAMARCAADHRIDPACRTQRRLVGIDPGLDLAGAKRSKAEEATAASARLDLGSMPRRVFVSCDAQPGIDHVAPRYHAHPLGRRRT
jgi:hypothetical protein